MTPDHVESAIRIAHWHMGWRMMHYEVHFLDPEVALFYCGLRDTNRKALISLARAGFRPAHAMLCEMAEILTAIGDPLPLWLQHYVVLAAEKVGVQDSRRGQNPLTNLMRDMVVAFGVDVVSQRYSLRPTRNAEMKKTECGCSIVAKALERLGFHMSEANVVAIWRTQRRLDLAEARHQAKRLSRAP